MNPAVNTLLGIAIGDALGVPVEFTGRLALSQNPVKDMRAFGTYHQPAGTWSDDSSLTFCLADSLCSGYDLEDMAKKFLRWLNHDEWTAGGHVFDVGNATHSALEQLMNGVSPLRSGMTSESQNGNGSLMRIMPLAFYLKNEPSLEKRFQCCKEVSGITHAHFRSIFACFVYVELAIQLIKGEKDKMKAYEAAMATVHEYDPKNSLEIKEIELYKRVLDGSIFEVDYKNIRGSGYVLHSLESSFWCWMNHNNYADAVLAAVNLGEDTDTTAAITGGLSGLSYGMEAIPADWLSVLKRKDDIIALGERLWAVC